MPQENFVCAVSLVHAHLRAKYAVGKKERKTCMQRKPQSYAFKRLISDGNWRIYACNYDALTSMEPVFRAAFFLCDLLEIG